MVHARLLVPQFTSLYKKISTTNLNIYNRVPCPNICFWDTLIRAHCERTEINKCFLVFKGMTRDRYTFPFLIEACSNALALREEGRITHGLSMLYGVESDMFARSSLIDFYGKREDIKCAGKLFDGLRCVTAESLNFGDLLKAKCLFDEMPVKSLATWNAMIKGLVRVGELKSARILFDEMPERNKVSFTTMIDGYAKVDDMVAARLLFDELPLPEKDLFSWSALISGYMQNVEPFQVLEVFPVMWDMNVKPDEFIIESLMSACSQLGFLELAKLIDSYMSGRTDVSVDLLDMNATHDVWKKTKLPRRYYFSYLFAIPSTCYMHCVLAVALFDRMINEGLRPDDVAFLAIIQACMYLGSVEDGRRYFDLMINEYSLSPSPDHYECIVNLLVQSGKLKAAYELIKSIPVKPHFRSWGALLGACGLYCDTDFAAEIGWQLVELIKSIPGEPHLGSSDILLQSYKLFDTDFAQEMRWQLIELQDHGGDPFLLFVIYKEASRWFDEALIHKGEYMSV